MLSFGVKSNLDEIAKAVDRLGKAQVPFATALALTRTAQLSSNALKSTMLRVFDRPKPYTLNSLFVKAATKTNLVAVVGHKQNSPVNAYLRSEIEGGNRGLKGFEQLLAKRGGGRAAALVPAKNLRLDAYGNVPRSVVNAVIAQAGKKNGTDPKGIFVVPVGAKSHLPPGVYQRVPNRTRIKQRGGVASAIGGGTRLKALMLFVDHPKYKQIYDVAGVVGRVVEAEFGKQFAASMDYALSTARVKI
jgi:hypothetical protein